MDTEYLPFYNQGYRILNILLPGIWDTVLNISVCRTGSAVVECLTRDRGAAGSSLAGVTALWSLSKTHLS